MDRRTFVRQTVIIAAAITGVNKLQPTLFIEPVGEGGYLVPSEFRDEVIAMMIQKMKERVDREFMYGTDSNIKPRGILCYDPTQASD